MHFLNLFRWVAKVDGGQKTLSKGDISFTDVTVLESGSVIVNIDQSMFTIKQAGLYFFQVIGFCVKSTWVYIRFNNEISSSFFCNAQFGAFYAGNQYFLWQYFRGNEELRIDSPYDNSIVINSPTKAFELRAYIVKKD